jgi:putative transcriptional regulator
MTQQQLADRVGCSRQTVILLEHGRYVPSLALAFRIAETFGLTVDEVFKYEGENQCKKSDETEIGADE